MVSISQQDLQNLYNLWGDILNNFDNLWGVWECFKDKFERLLDEWVQCVEFVVSKSTKVNENKMLMRIKDLKEDKKWGNRLIRVIQKSQL
jgi:hypothetical protein